MRQVIDFHTHVFPDRIAPAAVAKLRGNSHTRAFTDATEASLRESMERAGISLSVILPVATNPAQVIKVNDASLRINERTEETGLLSLGCMHPDYEGWHAELGRIASAGIRGVKLHSVYQGVDIDDPRFVRILSRCGELGLFVTLHAGLDVGLPGGEQAVPRKILNAIRQAGPVTLVLAHMGGWKCWDQVAELLPGTGVYLDTSFSLGPMTPSGDDYPWTKETLQRLGPEAFVRLVRRFGADHVLFGTDSPWADQEAAVRELSDLPLSSGEKDAILYQNAEKMLKRNLLAGKK